MSSLGYSTGSFCCFARPRNSSSLRKLCWCSVFWERCLGINHCPAVSVLWILTCMLKGMQGRLWETWPRSIASGFGGFVSPRLLQRGVSWFRRWGNIAFSTKGNCISQLVSRCMLSKWRKMKSSGGTKQSFSGRTAHPNNLLGKEQRWSHIGGFRDSLCPLRAVLCSLPLIFPSHPAS